MVLHMYRYRLKVLLRDRGFLFWTFIFPILLGLLFKMAFGNLDTLDQMEVQEVGIVAVDKERANTFQKVLAEVKTGDNPLFSATELTEKAASDQLGQGQIIGIYQVTGAEISLTIAQQGIPQTILKSIQDQYLQTESLIQTLVKNGQLSSDKIADLELSGENFVRIKNPDAKISQMSFYFFTLVGMSIMYGFMWGMRNANDQQANQSPNGIRLDMIPHSKVLIASVNLLAAFTVFYSCILLILGIFHFVYGIGFGSHWLQILLVCAIGSLTTIMLGTLLGTLLKNLSWNQKIGIGISVSMLMSFLAGMMGSQFIKYWIDQYFPFAGRLNIVNLISESLYQLFYYESLTPFYQNLLWLTGYLFLFGTMTVFFERRSQYDSL